MDDEVFLAPMSGGAGVDPTVSRALPPAGDPDYRAVPPLRCARCGAALSAHWDTGALAEDLTLAVRPHRCTAVTARIVSADALTDQELLAAVHARGL